MFIVLYTSRFKLQNNLNFYKMQDRIEILHQNGDIILQALFYFIAEYSELFKYSIGVDHVYV